MAIKSTKKVLASILSLAVVSQPFCGATNNFMENKVDPGKSIVIKKEKPTGFNKIKEFAKKHPVKAAVGGVVGLGTVIIVGGIIVKNAFFDDQNDQENILTAKDVKKRNSKKFNLTDAGVLTIKEGITAIGEMAFYECENLKEVSIPNSVTKIGGGAFNGCTNLKEVNFEENSQLTEIGARAFYECEKLNSVTIPNSVTTIGVFAFAGCTSLNSVTIPNSVTTIGDYAFAGCTSLNSVTIPNSVTTIGEYVFNYCTSLNSVTIPNSVTKIGEGAFKSCENLGEVKFEEKSQLKEIGVGAFGYCKNLNSVTIPNSVTKIGEGAFGYCKNLNSVTIPNSVKTIDAKAFWNTSLKNVTIPSNCDYVKGGQWRSFPANCVVEFRSKQNIINSTN